MNDDQSMSDLGKPLTDNIETFIGISGGNYGILDCKDIYEPYCNTKNGYSPNPSTFLFGLNANPHREAKYIFAMYSEADDIVGDLIGNQHTSLFPTVDEAKVYSAEMNYSNKDMRDLTADIQY